MSPNEITKAVIDFAKKNKISIANELTDINRFPPDIRPISVFMAGSPGAGKTEFSKELIRILEDGARHRVVRIDADELRDRMPGYTGHNSNLFHGAVSLIVEKIHDLVLSKNQTFILDGTFSKYEKAADNIRRSLDKNRTIFIFYIYQTPRTAWRLTQAREILEIVKIVDPNALIDSYIGEHYTREELEKLL